MHRFRVLASCLGVVVVATVPACRGRGTTSHPLTVFAAASLTEAFTDLQAALRKKPSELDVTFSFAGSGTLVAQIQQGAPADVIATADQKSMQQLVDARLVERPVTF